MTANPNKRQTTVDAIDRQILEILAENPRIPYSDIAEELEQSGCDLSSEAVRQRVTALLEITSNFFLLKPDTHDWEIMMVTVQTDDQPGSRKEVHEEMADMDYWFVGVGFGTFDIYGTATAQSTQDIDNLLEKTRRLKHVDNVEYVIETGRTSTVEEYLSIT